MELPKLVYDDFYKFLMSFGVVLLVVSIVLGVSIANHLILNFQWLFIILCISAFLFSIVIMKRAGKRWYHNQQRLDRILEAKTKLIEGDAQIMVKLAEKEPVAGEKTVVPEAQDKAKIALVTYKIASSFPELNTKPFNFLTDWQVWFLIENHEKKSYKAYITVEFFSDGHRERAGGSYDGTHGWNLNALGGVIAPGLGIPPWIKEKALQRKPIRIRILCDIKDENDGLIERKLPVEYAYHYENNSWYFNPASGNRDDF